MKSVFIFITVCFFGQLNQVMNTGRADVIDNIARCFATGNSKELAVYLSSMVSLSTLEDNNTYSKNQTEMLLRNFFDKYNFRGAKIIHRLDTNASNRYVVLELMGTKQKFRVSLSLKDFNSEFLITDIRIEPVE